MFIEAHADLLTGPKKPPVPGSFAMWMLGGTNRRGGRGGAKVEKKAEAPAPAPAP